MAINQCYKVYGLFYSRYLVSHWYSDRKLAFQGIILEMHYEGKELDEDYG